MLLPFPFRESTTRASRLALLLDDGEDRAASKPRTAAPENARSTAELFLLLSPLGALVEADSEDGEEEEEEEAEEGEESEEEGREEALALLARA